jgi:hypothetical protein
MSSSVIIFTAHVVQHNLCSWNSIVSNIRIIQSLLDNELLNTAFTQIWGEEFFFLIYFQESGSFVIITHKISVRSVWVFSVTCVISRGGIIFCLNKYGKHGLN